MAASNAALAAYKAGVRDRTKHKTHRKQMTIPIAVVAGFVPLAGELAGCVQRNDWRGLQWTVASLSGYDINTKSWDIRWAIHGLSPIVAGFAVHKVANMIGINRALSRAKVPWIRI